jgi:hypothetical protein
MSGRLNFEIDSELEPSLITPRAGLPSLSEAYRLSGTAAVVERTIKVKTRKRGLPASEMVESFLALWVAGGERAEDFDHLRQDKALAELIGHELPAAQTARDFLSAFHVRERAVARVGFSEQRADPRPAMPQTAEDRDARYRCNDHPLLEECCQARL